MRSGKVALTKEDRPRRRYTRRMVNPPNNQNLPNSNGESPLTSALEGSTAATSTAELVPSMTNSTPVQSMAQSGPILSYVGPQGPPVNPLGTHGPPVTPPRGNQFFRSYVTGFSNNLWHANFDDGKFTQFAVNICRPNGECIFTITRVWVWC